jgi:signal peptidase II
VNRKYLLFGLVTVALVALDQWTKRLVVAHIRYGSEEIRLIDGFLSLVHAQNTGGAGGLLAGFEHRMVLFGVVSAVATAALVHMVWQLKATDQYPRFQVVAAGVTLSGVLGNEIDRLEKQQVTDFIRVYTTSPTIVGTLRGWGLPPEWPSFNVADSAIVVGICLFAVYFFFLEKDEPDLEDAPPAEPLDIEPRVEESADS